MGAGASSSLKSIEKASDAELENCVSLVAVADRQRVAQILTKKLEGDLKLHEDSTAPGQKSNEDDLKLHEDSTAPGQKPKAEPENDVRNLTCDTQSPAASRVNKEEPKTPSSLTHDTTIRIYVLERSCMLKYKDSGKSLPVFQTLRELGLLKELTFTIRDVLEGKYRKILAAGSYSWKADGSPDPDGNRLACHIQFLEKHPDVEYMWIDFHCLPQGKYLEDGIVKQSPLGTQDADYFKYILHSGVINILYLFHQVSAIIDAKYLVSFWTQFEFYLATREFLPGCGLNFDPTRCSIHCIESLKEVEVAKPQAQSLLVKWGDKDVKEAGAILRNDDVRVTVPKDKDILIPKLFSLESDLLEFSKSLGMGDEQVRSRIANRAIIQMHLEKQFASSDLEWAIADPEAVVQCAKLAEKSECYDDMCYYMTLFAQTGSVFSLEQRNLLSVAFKNNVGGLRAAYRTLNAEGSLDTHIGKTVKQKLDKRIGDIMALLEGFAFSHSDDPQSAIFFTKMKADYYRYLIECSDGQEKSNALEMARTTYEDTVRDAKKHLACTHPMYLGAALNYSLFLYELADQPSEAVRFAREVYKNAIVELDDKEEDHYKRQLLQLLRYNVTLWTEDE